MGEGGGQMLGAVESGCVVVEAMRTADIYLRVLIFALLMKQLDFEIHTKTSMATASPGKALNSPGAAQAY
jgi:hypothetical protein